MTPSFKFTTLALLLSAATVGACGDDGNVLGTAGGAGSAGQSSGGSAGAAASGTAGVSTAGSAVAGTSSGGTGGSGTSGGGTSSGGKASCEIAECLRANVCLDKCGGKVVYTGCCACTTGTVEQDSCQSGAGGQGTGGSGQECVGMTCAAGEACVAHRTVGGAVVPPGAVGCMSGKHLEDASCQNDFKYACAALTCTAIGSGCRCAPDTSCAYTTNCRLPQAAPWLDTDAELICEQQVP